MALVKPAATRLAKIKVIGVGGGGGNAVNNMVKEENIESVDFVAVNTDAQALLNSQAPIKVQIGEELTRGLGSGANPEIGAKAAEESRDKIQDIVSNTDMVFITAGLGGGTGTGAAPIIAEEAKKAGALTVAIVTKPFLFEGSQRMSVAQEGAELLAEKVDTLITIPNQRLLETASKNLTFLEAFRLADSVLTQGVKAISDLITTPGLINVDFADVKTIMTNAGSALMGVGTASGEERAIKAAKMAISSPLLEVSIQGAKGILFNIIGPEDLTMEEVSQAAQLISETATKDANIIFGARIDPNLMDKIQISVIATGFNNRLNRHKTVQKTPSLPVTGSPEEELEDEFDIPAFMRKIK